ncbi:MAG: hypothetical protein WCL32_25545 [Planctomycetota bacterium]
MATAEELMAIVGASVDAVAVRELIQVDQLVSSTEPELNEGESPRAYLTGSKVGYQLMYHRGRVAAAFLYVEPSEGVAAFAGRLPGGLTSRATRNDVQTRFGAPEQCGEPITIAGLGRYGAWDRFEYCGVRIHFQYTFSGEVVRRVTIMSNDDVP